MRKDLLLLNIIIVLILLIALYFSINMFSNVTSLFIYDKNNVFDTKDNDSNKTISDNISDKNLEEKEKEMKEDKAGEKKEQSEEIPEKIINITKIEPLTNQTELLIEGLDLKIIDYEYKIIDDNWAKVTSLTLEISNDGNIGIYPIILVYLYDEDDSSSIKGLVRDQINIASLIKPNTIFTKTYSIDADYQGDLSKTKTLKVSLINSYQAYSENLASDNVEVEFLG